MTSFDTVSIHMIVFFFPGITNSCLLNGMTQWRSQFFWFNINKSHRNATMKNAHFIVVGTLYRCFRTWLIAGEISWWHFDIKAWFYCIVCLLYIYCLPYLDDIILFLCYCCRFFPYNMEDQERFTVWSYARTTLHITVIRGTGHSTVPDAEFL